MKTSSFTKQQLIDKLKNEGYKEISENYFQKFISRVEYSFELKNDRYIYMELEESIKEGWWREEWKYAQPRATGVKTKS